MEISKVLIIQNKRLGDVLLSSVIATNIKKNYKECTIHFFTYDYCAPVIGNHPHIDKIITENPDRLKKIPVLLSTCRKINAEKYDAIIDPYSKFQSKFMCYSSGASVRIGNTRAGKKSYWKPYNFTVEFKPKATLPCGKSIEILFKDHSPGNTLIQVDQNDIKFYLVDLNRLDFKTLNYEERLKNFQRLWPSKYMQQIIANEYASLSNQDPDRTYQILNKHCEDFKRKKHFKKQWKKKLGI